MPLQLEVWGKNSDSAVTSYFNAIAFSWCPSCLSFCQTKKIDSLCKKFGHSCSKWRFTCRENICSVCAHVLSFLLSKFFLLLVSHRVSPNVQLHIYYPAAKHSLFCNTILFSKRKTNAKNMLKKMER